MPANVFVVGRVPHPVAVGVLRFHILCLMDSHWVVVHWWWLSSKVFSKFLSLFFFFLPLEDVIAARYFLQAFEHLQIFVLNFLLLLIIAMCIC